MAQNGWDKVYQQTKTTSQSWEPLWSGSKVGYTLGAKGTTSYYHLTERPPTAAMAATAAASAAQQVSFLKHDGMLSVNVYDKFYKKVREKVKRLQKQRRKEGETGMKYSGSYTSGGRTIYRVELDRMRVDIADGCWQITRISYQEGQNDIYCETKEVRPGLFLPSKGRGKLYLDRAKWPKGYVSMKIDYAYRH